ncbi:hypothetical protein STEG23_005726, partial [Scotinomys teguina]
PMFKYENSLMDKCHPKRPALSATTTKGTPTPTLKEERDGGDIIAWMAERTVARAQTTYSSSSEFLVRTCPNPMVDKRTKTAQDRTAKNTIYSVPSIEQRVVSVGFAIIINGDVFSSLSGFLNPPTVNGKSGPGMVVYTYDPRTWDTYTYDPRNDPRTWDTYTYDPRTWDTYTYDPGTWDTYTYDPGTWDTYTYDPGTWDTYTYDPGTWDTYTYDLGTYQYKTITPKLLCHYSMCSKRSRDPRFSQKVLKDKASQIDGSHEGLHSLLYKASCYAHPFISQSSCYAQIATPKRPSKTKNVQNARFILVQYKPS